MRNPKTLKLSESYMPIAMGTFSDWVAMEMLPGADVRITVRNHTPVRLEVINRPDEPQRRVGIVNPWYKDAISIDRKSPHYWIWKALDGVDYSQVPDGEWEGEAIGPGIKSNPFELEESTVVFSSFFPWSESFPLIPTPPSFARTPIGFDDLRYFLLTTHSRYKENAPLEGLVWWWHDTPMAQVRRRDFPATTEAPNPEAAILIPAFEVDTFDGLLDG